MLKLICFDSAFIFIVVFDLEQDIYVYILDGIMNHPSL